MPGHWLPMAAAGRVWGVDVAGVLAKQTVQERRKETLHSTPHSAGSPTAESFPSIEFFESLKERFGDDAMVHAKPNPSEAYCVLAMGDVLCPEDFVTAGFRQPPGRSHSRTRVNISAEAFAPQRTMATFFPEYLGVSWRKPATATPAAPSMQV